LGNSNEDYEAFSTLARKFIVEKLNRESAYYEIHNLVREWCEAKISESEILDIHERAVKYYESLHDKNFPEIWELMRHALEAGIDNKAEEAANKILSRTLFYGLYDFALDLTNQLLEMPQPKKWYTLHFARGRIFRFKEQFDAALEEYQAAIKLANTNIYKDMAKFEAASILVTLVEFDTEIEDDSWSIAKSYYTDLLRSEDEEIRIKALFTLGDINTRDGYLEEGLRQILEALSQAEAAKFERTIYQICYRLGQIHSKVLSEQQQAIQYLERSLAIQQKNSDKLGGNDIDACYHISFALAELYEQLGCHLDSAQAWETCVEINYVLQLEHRLAPSLFNLARQRSLL
jgi:tetratricopeptide (TPR) repeat protein